MADMKHHLIYLLFLLIFLPSTNLYSQSGTSNIDFKKPDVELLERLVIDEINHFREQQHLHPLKQDSVLHKAAKEQAKYNYRNLRLDSYQSRKKMATPFLRVNQFGGMYPLIEESHSMVVMQEKTRVKGQRGRTTLNTYEEAAYAAAAEWIESRTEVKLLEQEDLYNIGVGAVFVPESKTIFVTATYGSEPYLKEEGIRYSSNSYKLRPYSREECKYFLREFGYLGELFSSSVEVENDSIFFRFHDLHLIKSLLKTGRDGMAIDIVKRDQFLCGMGNREHPAPVERGILLKPVKKGKLLRKNPLKEQNRFEAFLGKLPQTLDQEEVELNLLIIQNKSSCTSILYNNLDSRNVRLLDMDFALDTISITEEVDSSRRTIDFSIPFEKNKAVYEVEDIKPILDSIQLNRYNIKQISITAYSSIEGDPVSNEILQQKRAESILAAIQQYQLQTVKTKIQTFENWDGFYKSIEDSPYRDQFRSLGKEDIRAMVNADTLGYNLEPYLESQRKADVNIIVESIYIDSLTPELLPGKFMKAIKAGEPIIARGIQSMMLTNVSQGITSREVLFPDEMDIPFVKENMPIMNNIMAFKLKYYEGNDMDSLFEALKAEVNRYYTIDPNNAHLNYNKQLIELYYWSRNIHYLMVDKEANIDQPSDLYRAIRKLYNTKIDNWKVNQLLLNYHLIAADFYYETQDYQMREKSLKAVKRLILKSNLNREQTYIMAGYFMFQIHIDWAIEIMLPFIEKGDYDEDFLFRLISIAIYDEDEVSREEFIKLLEMAKETNETRYCELFGAPNMSFQLLSDQRIKDSYCTTCN